MSRLTLRLALALLSAVLLTAPQAGLAAAQEMAAPLAAPLEWDVPGGRFYTQANGFPPGTSPAGYAITDQDGVLLWSEFRRLGGVERLGYPASRRFVWGGFVTQATQKAVLQWRPEAKRAYFVNVFDDLSQAGKDSWLAAARSTPGPLTADFDRGRSWGQVVEGRLALLSARPALAQRYRAASDPLSLYGLPQSRVVDMGNHYAVRLQRAVLQEWKVAVPWARAGEVTVANGGDVAKEAGLFPPKALRPEMPPQGTWQAAPGRYSLAGRATWYGPGFQGKPMASGPTFDTEDPTITAANAYPLGSRLRVTSLQSGKSVDVVVRDTGDFQYPIVVDLSRAAFRKLGHPDTLGTTAVRVELLAER